MLVSKQDRFKGGKTSRRGSVWFTCGYVYARVSCVCVCMCVCVNMRVLRGDTQRQKGAGNDFVLEYNKYTEWFHYEASSGLCVTCVEFVCVFCGTRGDSNGAALKIVARQWFFMRARRANSSSFFFTFFAVTRLLYHFSLYHIFSLSLSLSLSLSHIFVLLAHV